MRTQNHFYLRFLDQNGNAHPCGVVAMRFDPEEMDEFSVAISFCSPKDQWDRNTGVSKAYGRLDSCKVFDLEAERPIDAVWADIDSVSFKMPNAPSLRLLLDIFHMDLNKRPGLIPNWDRMEDIFRRQLLKLSESKESL